MRAFYTFLTAITVVWALPRNASAQLYVAQTEKSGRGFVSEYNATTGAVTNPKLISALNSPSGLALSGNTLFVANASTNTVGKYDATTGGAINAGFIPGGLLNPTSLALLTSNILLVANAGIGTVAWYNATTGAAINPNFITGLHVPEGLAVMDNGSTVFVTNFSTKPLVAAVGKYDYLTGDAKAHFITGLKGPFGLALKGNRLFVSVFYSNTVVECDATTGEVINDTFITELKHPQGLALSGNKLFVVNASSSTVGVYDATNGAVIKADFITGLSQPTAIAVKTSTGRPGF